MRRTTDARHASRRSQYRREWIPVILTTTTAAFGSISIAAVVVLFVVWGGR